jgi:hypothetical protein
MFFTIGAKAAIQPILRGATTFFKVDYLRRGQDPLGLFEPPRGF